jgi:uncharacterized phage-like protein YoqJ
MVVSVTGHRPDKLGGYDFYNPKRSWVRDRLKDELNRLKPSSAICGMALGVDQDFAFVCLELGIPFLAAIPFIGQERIWPKESQDLYSQLLSRAYHIVVVSEGGYAAWKMQIRNEWMVDNCDTLIAVWDGTSGGTRNCVKYATKVHKHIVRIDPSNFHSG